MGKNFAKIKPIINQAEIARRLGVDKSYIGLLFAGKRRNKERIRQIREILIKELKLLKGE
jgi:transcriptional regulator with XRE-family HTH domain